MLEDYNSLFGTCFNISGYASFKRDVCARLAHKTPYTAVEMSRLSVLTFSLL